MVNRFISHYGLSIDFPLFFRRYGRRFLQSRLRRLFLWSIRRFFLQNGGGKELLFPFLHRKLGQRVHGSLFLSRFRLFFPGGNFVAQGDGPFDGKINGVENGLLADEPHLNFGRVDVDVHHIAGQADVQNAGGEFAGHNGGTIGFLQGYAAGPGLSVAAVDEKVLHGAVGAAVHGLPSVAGDMHAPQLVIHRQKVLGKLPAENGVDNA